LTLKLQISSAAGGFASGRWWLCLLTSVAFHSHGNRLKPSDVAQILPSHRSFFQNSCIYANCLSLRLVFPHFIKINLI